MIPAMLSSVLLLVIASNIRCGIAFVPTQKQHQTRIISSTSTKLYVTPAEAISILDASQQNSVNTIASTIPDLEKKPDLSWLPQDGVMIDGQRASLDGRDAPGPANIAWLSSLCIDGRLSSLTIFNGPLTDIPHLLSRCAISKDGTSIEFALDFRPRAYGAYELRDADGNYPGPETLGRQAFEYSGARKDYETKFVTDDDVVAFLKSTYESFDGPKYSIPFSNDEDKLTCGPYAMCVSMPLTDGNVERIKLAKEKAVQYWLSWVTDPSHEHRPGAPVNTQYVYDTKYKQNAYGALLPTYITLFGSTDGTTLTAADSGPLDEAYVGGGS